MYRLSPSLLPITDLGLFHIRDFSFFDFLLFSVFSIIAGGGVFLFWFLGSLFICIFHWLGTAGNGKRTKSVLKGLEGYRTLG